LNPIVHAILLLQNFTFITAIQIQHICFLFYLYPPS
jgi:hypothetical protein